MTKQPLLKTCLNAEHIALGAKMVPFGGWEMPVQYEGIISEYEATRKIVTMFDISHMGEFIIEGDYKESGLDYLVSMRLSDMPIKTSRYGFLLNKDGGVIDDLIVFRLEQRKWMLVVNAATIKKDFDHIKKFTGNNCILKDISNETGKLDIQGPKSREILASFIPAAKNLEYYNFDIINLLGEQVIISRTGYTGELGFEVFLSENKTKELWKELLKNDMVKPAGLGARDILRLEVGYPLYGHELNEKISPLEAGLSKFVDLEKDFLGKDALLKQKQSGVKRKLVGLISESRKSPRAEQKIIYQDCECGYVTSGSFSPALNRGIGLALVNSEYSEKIKKGDKVLFSDGKNNQPAVVSERIFYKNGSLKD